MKGRPARPGKFRRPAEPPRRVSGQGLFIWGRQPVRLALGREALSPRSLFVKKGAFDQDPLLEIARSRRVAIHQLEGQDLDRRWADTNHQGIVLELESVPEPLGETDLLDDEAERALILVLDQVTDPMNLGAIFRVAQFFGATGLVYPKRRSASVDGVVIKAGAGAPLLLPYAEVSNISDFLLAAKQANHWTYGTSADADSKPCWDVDLTGRTVVVLGSEGAGLRRLVRERCDAMIALPGSGFESLNVATAAAALCYEVTRQEQSRANVAQR